MTIKFLADRYRLPRLGRIRLGHKESKTSRSGKKVEYPVADPFFVVPPEIAQIYGAEPTTLHIEFLFDSLELTFPHYLRRYTASGLRCLGDGDMVMYRINDAGIQDVRDTVALDDEGKGIMDGNAVRHVQCPGQDCPHYIGAECKPTGYLKFMVEEIPRQGYYDIVCRQRAVVGIRTQLLLCQQMFGRLTGIPFLLHRGDVERIPVKTANGMRDMPVRTQWIEIDPGWFGENYPRRQEVLLESVQRRRLLAAQASVDLFGEDNGHDTASEAAIPDPAVQFEEELYNGEAGTPDDGQDPDTEGPADETVRLEQLSLKELRMLILTAGQERFGEEAPAVLARVQETLGKPLYELDRVEAEELAETWLKGREENGH